MPTIRLLLLYRGPVVRASLALVLALAAAPAMGSERADDLRGAVAGAVGRHPGLGAIRDPRAGPRFDDPDEPTTLARPPAPGRQKGEGDDDAGDDPTTLDEPSAPRRQREERRSRSCGRHPSVVAISAYDDDPFVDDAIVECMDASRFHREATGRLILSSAQVKIEDEPVIYREDRATGEFRPFAINPWPCAPPASNPAICAPPTSNARGEFFYPDEPRFPLHQIERDSDGRPILDANGLQIWKPRDLHRGMTTAFEAAHAARDAAEFWSGRRLPWGLDDSDQLPINAHAFIDFNAFFAPSAGQLFFGVVPYRLPGETDIKMFEMATSWEVAAHESGHAVHHVLKPNRDPTNLGFRTWGESFSDQLAMWTSLRDPQRVRALLAGAPHEDLVFLTSGALSRIGEVFASLVGESTGLRDAFHNKTVSQTSNEIHDRSEPLSGAAYKFALRVYREQRLLEASGARALKVTGRILGTFLVRAADFTPENTMTLEDVAKAYLKVDKEFFAGRYHDILVGEFVRRELFHAGSVAAWQAHEAAVPLLQLPEPASPGAIAQLVQANLDRLGIGPDFGLRLQSVIRDERFGQTIVRVQLTEGRGTNAPGLDNHGILVFRRNDRLADYHAPLPPDVSPVEALALIDRARHLGLDQQGALLSLARKPDGQLTVEARVMRGGGLNAYVEAFTLDNPRGERREIITGIGRRTKADLLKRGVLLLTPEELAGP